MSDTPHHLRLIINALKKEKKENHLVADGEVFCQETFMLGICSLLSYHTLHLTMKYYVAFFN